MHDRSQVPERDQPARQPLFNIPGPVLVVIAMLVLVHVTREVIPEPWDDAVFSRLALVPGRLAYAVAPDRVIGAIIATAAQGPAGYRQAQVDRFFLGDGSAQLWTMLSYAVLHADWTHLGLNAVWLLAFGSPVARRFGTLRFLLFLAGAAWAGALVHCAVHLFDLEPVIGASAAVSGCMGATLRFMFQPHTRIADLLDTLGEARRQTFLQPAQSLRELLKDRRAVTFLVAWFATNLLFGLGSVSLGGSGPIAWEAHIGGFLIGLLLFRLFDPVAPTLAGNRSGEAPMAPPVVPPDP